ncbi:MAG: hypothetical protein HJJLKODD_01616 [Phycisphaerae bacterium]|nr:hypothetical protein [Phycisphaerae bacterium]
MIKPLPQKVRKAELWSVGRIFLLAAGTALLYGVIISPIVGVMWYFESSRWPDMAEIALITLITALGFLVPSLLIIRFHSRLRKWWHGFFFGFFYLGWIYLVPVVMEFSRGSSWMFVGGRWIWILISMLSGGLLAAAINGGLFTLVWVASRKSRGKLLVTHKSFCPGCGYNLIGNTTGICSECGRPFTLDELEILSDDLDPAFTAQESL